MGYFVIKIFTLISMLYSTVTEWFGRVFKINHIVIILRFLSF